MKDFKALWDNFWFLHCKWQISALDSEWIPVGWQQLNRMDYDMSDEDFIDVSELGRRGADGGDDEADDGADDGADGSGDDEEEDDEEEDNDDGGHQVSM